MRFKAFEGEIVRPFPTFDDLLIDCKIMVSNDEGFLDECNILVDGEIDCVRLQLKIDEEQVKKVTAELSSNLVLDIFFKDLRGAKNFQVLFSSPLKELSYKVIELDQLLPGNFLATDPEILLILTDDSSNGCKRRLGKKNFKFLRLTQALDFPKCFRTPEQFEDAGFFREAPWAIKWVGEDLNKPIDQLIEVWLNKSHELSLQKFGVSDQGFAKTTMIATLLQDILYKIITQAINTDNHQAIAANTVFGLLEVAGITQQELILAYENPDFKSIVNSWAMKISRLDGALKNEFQ